jgi:hypothetical protein
LFGLQHALQSGEYGDMASLFSSSSYPQQVEAYEQSYGDDCISLEQNFQSSWNVFSEDNTEITKSVCIRVSIVIKISYAISIDHIAMLKLLFSCDYIVHVELNAPSLSFLV